MAKPFDKQTFGPVVSSNRDGTDMVAKCTWCFFRSPGGTTCTHVNPPGALPEGDDRTPDWCEMREDMLRDAREMMEAELIVTKTLPAEIKRRMHGR